jgi:hypothetical protein
LVSRNDSSKELELVFDHVPKNHITVSLGNFNAVLEGENIFNPTLGNEVLYENNYDNGVRVVKVAT